MNKKLLLLVLSFFSIAAYQPISRVVQLDPLLYDDLSIPAHALTLGAQAPDAVSILGSGGIKGLAFDGNATTESMHGSTEMLHKYVIGTDINPHVHWMPTTADIGSVKWQLEYSWQNEEGVFTNPTTVFGITTSTGTAWTLQRTNFPTMNGTGKDIGSGIIFRIFRDPTDSDTYGADAALVHIGVHYKVDTLGSTSEDVK